MRVVIVLYPGFQPLDVTGPHEVLAAANEVMDGLGRKGPRYELVRAAVSAGPVASESGLQLVAEHSFADVAASASANSNSNSKSASPRAPIHTLLIPGGTGAMADQEATVTWLAAGVPAQRVATVCTGTFLAADAGLLHGRRVTTHWARAGELARRHPDLTVDPDPIYIKSDHLWTSAGVTAGIDLALALVEEDCGAEVARLVARYLVVYLRRPGGQSQFGTPVWSEPAIGAPIRDACDIIHAELEGDLSVNALAARVGLSSRHFARRFRSEVGEPVAKHVERLRVEAARQLLETGDLGLEAVATECGFGSAEILRRAFHRRLEISPDAYRRQFVSTAKG